MDALAVGVDLGGTQIRAGLVRPNGEVLRRVSTATRSEEGIDAVVDRIEALIRQVLPSPPSRVRGIGVAAPGALDPYRGVIRFAPNLVGWVDVPLGHMLEERLGLPVILGNDANVAALAEHRYGAGQGVRDMIYITVSTGIGGGIIVDGRLLVGHKGYAGEIGHQTVEDGGPRCKCGNVGCLEALASGTAIAREARVAIAAGESTRLRALCDGDIWRVDARMVAQAAREGDAVALRILQRAGHYLGVGIVNLIHLFNPRRIILGGSVMKAGDLITGPMWEVIETRAWSVSREEFDIVPAALGDNVGILGAAALVFEKIGH
ncbi:MAG: ROK family protein [Chloroflexi bacterium]|nr:ROK family protein [Chloroflexota bacterium]